MPVGAAIGAVGAIGSAAISASSGSGAPDPYATANAQGAANVETAREQARLAMTGQTTPWGTLSYEKDPTSPSGYRAVQALTPESQTLLEQSQALSGQYGDVASAQLGRVGETFGTPFDLSAGRATELTDMQSTFLDPQWDRRSEQLQTQLMNRGIRPGSDAYDNEMRMFGQQRDDAYNKMFLDAWTTANNAALTERNIPISDLNALGVGAQPQQVPGVQPINTPAPGVAPTDIVGPVYQSYQIGQNARNADMGGIYGIAGSALGGWAQSGFAG